MTGLDYIVLAVAALLGFAGWRRGVLRGTFAIGAALLGVVLASNFYAVGAFFVSWLTTSPRAADLLGFALIFVLTIAAGAYAGHRLRKALERARLSWVDRTLGTALGLVRAWLICSAIYLALTAFPVRIEAVERSMLAPVLVEGTRVLAYLGSEEFRRKFRDGYDTLHRLWDSTTERTTQ